MTQQHSAREVERMSHSPVCVCVCDRQRDWGQMSALRCAAGLLCSSCTCAVRSWHLAVPYYPRTALLHQWRTNGPCPASLCVSVCAFHNLTTDAFQVSERLCVCDHTLYLCVIAVSTFLLLIHHSSLPHFAKAIPAMVICIRPAERYSVSV